MMNTYEQKIPALYDARQDYQDENMELDKKYCEVSVERRAAIAYAAITIFCFVFAKVYLRFSHGVTSPYMTYLFIAPLALGWLPSLAMWLAPRLRRGVRGASADESAADHMDHNSPVCRNAWHSGVAAVTVSALLRGIFEIAGTASPLQSYLMGAGIAMLLVGAAAYLLRK
ncbi:MAG: hypothetical protein IJH91_07550 [Mogibacterium sp.]|nr:hypothetical protein [Mogibacterium sp.]